MNLNIIKHTLYLILFLPLMQLFAQTPQYENQLIEKIEVIFMNCSETTTDEGVVKSRMKTKEGQPFNHLEFDYDLKALVNDFDRVEPSITSVQDKVLITLKIWPKPTIRTITWFGNEHISTKSLQSELNIPLSTIFDRQTFNRAFHKLKAYYVKKGYFEAELDYKVTRDPLTDEVDILITIVEGRSGKIKDIEFINFTSDEESDIADIIITQKYNFFLNVLNGSGVYNEEMIQRDQFMVLNYLQNKGYADAKVEILVTEVPFSTTFEMRERDRILVTIYADKGPQFTFGNISFKGNCLFDDCVIERQLLMDEGDLYSPEIIRETIENIRDLYGRKGYIDANVDYEVNLADGGCVYNLSLTIEEGDQFRVGLIKIFGNTCTETRVILHETLLIPGEVFNSVKLKKTEERLQNIGYFKNVNVYAVKSETALGPTYRDVHVEVEETSTGKISAMFGYSSVESLFCGLSISEENFNSKGLLSCWKKGPCMLRGGGEFLSVNTSIGLKSRTYGLSWTKPYVYDTPWTIGFDLQQNTKRYISDDYDIQSINAIARAFYQLNSFVKLGYHYRFTDSKLDITEDDPNHPLKKASRENGQISAYGMSVIYDSTNSPVRPTDGIKSIAEMELAGIGGHHSFISLAYLNSYYYPLSAKSYFKFRADFRVLDPFSGTRHAFHKVPVEERFFLGGEYTIRGFRPYMIGPQFKSKKHKRKNQYADDPSGGLSMSYYSIEYDVLLHKRAEGFLFVDAGNLSTHRYNFKDFFRISAGFGARLKVLDAYPPVTLGVGFPINPRNRSEVKRFFLTFGGQF